MTTNHQRVTEGFDILTGVLTPFVAAELRAKYHEEWWDMGVLRVLHDQNRRGLPDAGEDERLIHTLDAKRCLVLIDVQWDDVFRRKLSRDHRTWIKELGPTRDKWAHKGLLDIADEDAWRALDTMTRLVEQLDAEATERLRALARTVRYGTTGPSTAAPAAEPAAAPEPVRARSQETGGVLAAVPRSGLLPWRQVARPHPDVAAGRYRQAEFAADLSQVVRGTAAVEYQDPVEFFARTYLTEGMRGLLVQVLRRITGQGGEPVIQLKTAFGGGKTHSLLALYHLLRGRAPLARLPHVQDLLKEAGVEKLPVARVPVLVGTALNPTKERRPPNQPGITIKTLWGEIGAQIAEQAGNAKLYEHVKDADRKGVPPGSEALRELLDAAGPCLILIDELVAYARKIHGVDGLPSGSFAAVLTFIQELTEAVRKSRNTALVATIPESDLEIGGEAGQQALATIEHTFGRMEAIWKPVGAEEGFEVVRRRLFLDLEDVPARDDVCRAFAGLYRDNAGEFPPEAREARYLERMQACYPIHPEVFDRLYGDWSTLERFQRTRGVLRLMAAVIHDLWVRNDAGFLIMPGSVGLDAVTVREELTRYLPEGWTGVVESDVDGPKSGPRQTDAQNPRFGQTMAARRMARAVFLGSAPHVVQQQVRGVEDVRLRLGVVQPGEQVSVFNDALSQLSDRLTYLYRKDRRYWYDTRPNLRRTVEDRAQQLTSDDVLHEIERRVRAAVPRDKGLFKAVHACPAGPGDVPDDQEARLVVLGPKHGHKGGERAGAAVEAAAAILASRGAGPRLAGNMLVFLAADRDQVPGLEQEVRRSLAWASVVRDQDVLNLDAYGRREAAEGVRDSEQTVQTRLKETWRWLLVPVQPVEDGKVGALEWEITPATGGGDGLVERASKKAQASEHLIARWSPALLRMELDRWFWRDADHVPLKQLWEALCRYQYLPRLTGQQVLVETIREGLRSKDYFAYATSVSAAGRYEGLSFGEVPITVHIDAASVLVKTEAALRQLERERPGPAPDPRPGDTPGGRPDPRPPGDPPPPTPPRPPRRCYGTVELSPDRLGSAAGRVAEEIVQRLQGVPGARLTITLNIDADADGGFPDEVRRVVGENCTALKFKEKGFTEG